MSAKIRFINLKFPALCPCFRKDLKHYFMAEIVVPAVHRVAIYANNFSADGRNGGRNIGADARDVKPLFLKRCTLRLVRPRGAGRLCRVQGIIDTALARALHELEDDGILTRHDAKTMPMSVTYHLTDLGKKPMPALNALYGWGEEHRASAEEYKRSDGNKNL